MCLFSALSFSSSWDFCCLVLGFVCRVIFVTFDKNARILIFLSFQKCIVYSALSQLISHLLAWNVLYGNKACCLCTYPDTFQCSVCQLAFSVQSAKGSLLRQCLKSASLWVFFICYLLLGWPLVCLFAYVYYLAGLTGP